MPLRTATETETPECPDCGTPMERIERPGGQVACRCPVAVEAQRRGFLGQPGRKHKSVVIYVRKPVVN
jgi:hypothetical protein